MKLQNRAASHFDLFERTISAATMARHRICERNVSTFITMLFCIGSWKILNTWCRYYSCLKTVPNSSWTLQRFSFPWRTTLRNRGVTKATLFPLDSSQCNHTTEASSCVEIHECLLQVFGTNSVTNSTLKLSKTSQSGWRPSLALDSPKTTVGCWRRITKTKQSWRTGKQDPIPERAKR